MSIQFPRYLWAGSLGHERHLWYRRATTAAEARDLAITKLQFTAGSMENMSDSMHAAPVDPPPSGKSRKAFVARPGSRQVTKKPGLYMSGIFVGPSKLQLALKQHHRHPSFMPLLMISEGRRSDDVAKRRQQHRARQRRTLGLTEQLWNVQQW